MLGNQYKWFHYPEAPVKFLLSATENILSMKLLRVCLCVCVWRMFCRCLFSPPLLGWLPFRVKSITQSDSLSAKNVCVMEFVGKRRSLSPLQLFRHFNDIAMGIRMGDVHLHNQTISIRCSLFFLLFFFFSIDRMAFIMFLKRLVCISKYDMVANTCNIKMYMLACQCRWSHHGFFPQHTHAIHSVLDEFPFCHITLSPYYTTFLCKYYCGEQIGYVSCFYFSSLFARSTSLLILMCAIFTWRSFHFLL